MEEIKFVIDQWLKCEITGDNAMGQVVEIFKKNRGNQDEIINACTKEK